MYLLLIIKIKEKIKINPYNVDKMPKIDQKFHMELSIWISNIVKLKFRVFPRSLNAKDKI